MEKTRFVLTGGFLAAGKTSLGIKLAQYLKQNNRSASLITNDQSVGLVDTARVRHAGFPVKEVTGSCFCCNYNGLITAAEAFRNQEKPEVIIAEPVGSCTDLMATIGYPLEHLNKANYERAPLSVIVDPFRFAEAYGIVDRNVFSEKVIYIYQKQIEEAEIIVINKVDLLNQTLRNRIADDARMRFPLAKVFEVSCHTGEGLEEWFKEVLAGEAKNRPAMEVDYDLYAEGEALMGWLNASAHIPETESIFDGNDFLLDVSKKLNTRMKHRNAQIAHLKMTLTGENGTFGSVSLTRTGNDPVITNATGKVSGKRELIVNLRAETDIDLLRSEVFKVLAGYNVPMIESLKINVLQPGRPNPTHRLVPCPR